MVYRVGFRVSKSESGEASLMNRLKGAELSELWRARVRRFEVGGQTVAEFCQWEGVSAAAFYLWRKKLRELAPKHKTPVTTKSGDTLRRPLFVPVVYAAKPKSAAKPVSAIKPVADTVAIVVMTLSDGTRVELPASDHQLIAHVVTSTVTAVASLQGGDR
jgi:transposase-like protein